MQQYLILIDLLESLTGSACLISRAGKPTPVTVLVALDEPDIWQVVSVLPTLYTYIHGAKVNPPSREKNITQ